MDRGTGCRGLRFNASRESAVKSILDEAKQIVEQRDKTHGNFHHNLGLTAKFWDAYLKALPDGYVLQPHNVCDMENLKKISRSVCGIPIREHYLDIAGYCDLAVRIIEGEVNDDD
tara:strand:- start:326 stop:670 length:345 start_codon:yes stop_codon:yes gene_type:complete